jgi:4-amino-4-deoxy-L-arabinose transferase-like glycosyltransferase
MKLFRIPNSLIILFIIFLLGTTVRFIGLGQNPVGIVDDEADTAYDAYSLIRTGKDQWGTYMPITSFRGFGDYRLPAYTYLSVPAIAAFGLTPFAVRMPAAVFGSLTIFLVYWLVKELFGRLSESLPLLSAFLLAISPWHVGMSRIGLEETTSVFFVTAGLLALLKGRERPMWLLVGSVLFAISLYIYTPNILLVPFLFIAVVYFFRAQYKRLRRYVLLGACSFFLVVLPILFAQGNSTASTRTRQVNFTNDSGTIDIVNEKQGACLLMFPRTLCRVVFNKYNAFGTKFISNYLNHFSPNLLSIYGTNTQYSILPGRGLLYVVDYSLLIVGLIAVFVNPMPGGLLLAAFLFFSAVPDSLTSDGQFGRFFVSYPTWPILSAFAIVFIANKFQNYRAVLSAVVVLFCLAFTNFLVEYWTFFPYRYSAYSHYGYESLIGEIQNNIHSYDRIVASSRVNDSKQYIYYLFYTRYDPVLFQSGKGIEKVLESNGWVRVKRINSIEFLPVLPGRDETLNERVLLIGAPAEFPKAVPTVVPAIPIPVEFTVKDKAGNILFEGVDSAKLYL